ncbi:M15 family metallopeptidase [Flavobacterium aquatile]|uniref:D-alanyl-D-alanine dipeptidase n=1 Tax=Flavobacterium aquatile LMG 4008 = ATCC 11947 TaxID=1453498 RepID=A0A095SSB8_9FLAO|nr:M15 family metallopeptidase [Flavobacterium aquatile]KGD67526.1 peptidase M15 [Flavobacterium aquatile LMG 4008 = ATCC 11947]OXA65538.1 peptidase M15 [Flavobacterium aquatile] [Flavobacterium aquatile LMG 4008 = ATCC 11947]GEC79971.1 D-alanyl-D-alanine dipeptidase [Flavobacterium aquatile]
MFKKICFLFFINLLLIGCKSTESILNGNKTALKNNYLDGNSIALYEGINDTTFVKLKNFSSNFIFDMKYATEDNFLKKKVYDCDDCYLRLKTIKSLINANNEFLSKGYRIKIFDCYRPLDIQKKMFELVPNPDYVADPKRGSIHNRGGAVDLTLVDENGNELDMGTTFDFFGPEASHNYADFSKKIRKNRVFLKEIMIKNNFKPLNSEWWHYNLNESSKDNLANFKWDCN